MTGSFGVAKSKALLTVFAFSLLIAGLLSVPVLAQEGAQEIGQQEAEVPQAPEAAQLASPAQEDLSAASEAGVPFFDAEAYQSLVFTHWEHVAINDARKSVGMVRPPTEAELTRDLKTREDEKVKPPPEKRYVTLSGIVYKAPEDWTIWLNEQRVTPEALPKEVLDLKVFKSYIEVKWFDEYTNQIFPIRLRPHQRFHVDTRIFLPG